MKIRGIHQWAKRHDVRYGIIGSLTFFIVFYVIYCMLGHLLAYFVFLLFPFLVPGNTLVFPLLRWRDGLLGAIPAAVIGGFVGLLIARFRSRQT